MDNPCVEQFISSVAQSLKPGYPELINSLSFSECRKEIDSLLSNRYDAQTASKDPLLTCLLLNFHRQTSLAFQSNAALDREVEYLKAQNASLLHEVQTASKKAMRYLGDLHSTELELCSHKEELLKVRSEHPAPPQSFSRCESGYSDSHSSLDERSTPPSFRWEHFPTDPQSLGMKSAPQPPLRDRVNSLTSHLPLTDTEETGSLSSSRHTAHTYSQPLIHNTFVRALPSEGRTRSCPDCSASSPYSHESEHRCPASASHPERSTLACDRHVRSHARLISPFSEKTSQSPRLEVLELIAKDIEMFDPDNRDQDIDDYVRELDINMTDLPNANQREKIKLMWKTSSKAVHKFIQAQPPRIRDDYAELCHALKEEYSSPADEIASLVAASQIKHSRREHPRDFYKRLRHAYFQGKNAPGLEESSTFKSLFLRNLHPCVRTHVSLRTHQGNPSLNEIRKMTQMAWETVVNSKERGKTTEPACSDTRASPKFTASQVHPHYRSKGGDKRPHRDTERNRHVHHQRRNGNTSPRSSRRPYSEIMAQKHDLPLDSSDDDYRYTDRLSDHGHKAPDSDSASDCPSDYGYPERYSPEPRVRRHSKRMNSRVR